MPVQTPIEQLAMTILEMFGAAERDRFGLQEWAAQAKMNVRSLQRVSAQARALLKNPEESLPPWNTLLAIAWASRRGPSPTIGLIHWIGQLEHLYDEAERYKLQMAVAKNPPEAHTDSMPSLRHEVAN